MTREDLRKVFENATDEQISQVLDINSADIGRAKKKLEDNIAGLTAELTSVSDKLKAYDGVDLDALRQQLAAYEQAEQQRKQEAQQQEHERLLHERFDKLNGDRQYINEFTKNGVYGMFKAELDKQENQGKSDAEIYGALVKDKDGIFANPNAPQAIHPAGGSSVDDMSVMRAAMGLKN